MLFTEYNSYYVSEMAVLNTVFVFYESSTKNQCFTFSFLISFFFLFSFLFWSFIVLLYRNWKKDK